MNWTRDDLAAAGFNGFVTFSELPDADIPAAAGVYVVVRAEASPPRFLQANPAGRFKGKDPSVEMDMLNAAWITASPVLYIGKASAGRTGRRGLRKRLDEYRRHGAGQAIGHWGGRYIWQLAESSDLLVAWKETGPTEAEDVESQLITEFVNHFGARPFANRKLGRSLPVYPDDRP